MFRRLLLILLLGSFVLPGYAEVVRIEVKARTDVLGSNSLPTTTLIDSIWNVSLLIGVTTRVADAP